MTDDNIDRLLELAVCKLNKILDSFDARIEFDPETKEWNLIQEHVGEDSNETFRWAFWTSSVYELLIVSERDLMTSLFRVASYIVSIRDRDDGVLDVKTYDMMLLLSGFLSEDVHELHMKLDLYVA